MKDSLQHLAAELKTFLTAQGEDLILAAAPTRAAASVSANEKETAKKISALEQAQESSKPHTPEMPTSHAKETMPAQETMHISSAVPPMKEGSNLTVSFRSAKPQHALPSNEDTMQKQQQLAAIAQAIEICTRCPLGSTRLHAVPGEGNPDADVMFVGEGPGFDEDRQGRPFVGRAGQLLDKMILAMGLSREKVFIANIAKCHPMTDPLHPEKHNNDRPPTADEIACCRKYIEQQIAVVCPKYIVALGKVATGALLGEGKDMKDMRGKFYDLHLDTVTLARPVQVMPTFHPAALLRNPTWKKDAWVHLQLVMDALGLKGARK